MCKQQVRNIQKEWAPMFTNNNNKDKKTLE